MRQFMSRVSRVGSSVDSSRRHDAEEEDRVPDVVERVDADCLAWLQTYGFEACDQLADDSQGPTG